MREDGLCSHLLTELIINVDDRRECLEGGMRVVPPYNPVKQHSRSVRHMTLHSCTYLHEHTTVA